MPWRQIEREQLEQAIAAQEGLRGTLDDATVDALTKQLAELEAAGRAEQRKLATILFMDTVGSTEMIQALDPEEHLAIMDAAMQRLSVPVEEHGGRVATTMGDGFMATFGLPVARENDPDMAVRAGLAILAAAEAYAGEVRDRWGVQAFSVRVGINTGQVVVAAQKGKRRWPAAQSTWPPGWRARPRLDDLNIVPGLVELPGGRQPCQAGAQDEHLFLDAPDRQRSGPRLRMALCCGRIAPRSSRIVHELFPLKRRTRLRFFDLPFYPGLLEGP